MPDNTGLKGMSSPQADLEDESKALSQVTRETGAHTRAMQQNSRALQDNSQAWGRLRKEQETYMDRLKTMKDNFLQTTNGMAGTQQALGNFTNKMKQGTTVTSVYARKLDAMRKGQTAFAGTMVATTGDISKAMDQSQKYVTAVHDSYQEAHKMSGKYRVETAALRKAMDDLNERFATQIAVSGDMKGAITGMTEQALLMSKYLGTSMQDVMDSWQERLQQSTLSLEESKEEMIRVTYQADKYAKSVEALGKAYLKTGNIGKKEFVQMVRDIGKQFRHGTVEIDGYAAALTKLLTKSKEMGMSANEQRGIAEGLGKLSKSMFTEGGEMSFFGMKAAGKMRERMEAGDGWLEQQSAPLQKRIKRGMEATKGESALVKDRMLMSIVASSNAGNAMGMQMMQEMMKDKSLNREMMAKAADVGLFQAEALRESIQSGEAEETFKKAAEEDEKGKKEQTKIWQKSLEEISKAALTPKNTEYKMVAGIHKIQKTMEFWMKASLAGSLLTQGGFMGANMAGNLARGTGLFGGGAGKLGLGARLAGGAGKLGLGSLFTGGGSAVGGAAVPGSAGFIGPVAPAAAGGAGATAAGMTAIAGGTVAAFLGGVAIGTAADYGAGKVIDSFSSAREKKIAKLSGEENTFSSWLSRGSTGKVGTGVASMLGGDKFDEKGWKMLKDERVLLEGQEFKNRKDLIKSLEEVVKNMTAREKDLTIVEREKLRLAKEQLAQAKKSIKKRTDSEKKESKEADTRLGKEQASRVRTWAKHAKISKDPAEAAKQLMGATMKKNRYGFSENVVNQEGNVGEQILEAYSKMSKSEQARFTDIEETARQAELQQAKLRLGKSGIETKDMSAAQVGKIYKKQYGTDLGAFGSLASHQKSADASAAIKMILPDFSGDDDFWDTARDAVSEVTLNSKNEISFTIPGRSQKVVLKGMGGAAATEQHNKEKNG